MSSMSRRGFFARLFGKEEAPPPSHCFIGMQVVMLHDARPTVRQELHTLIHAPTGPTVDDRRQFFKRLLGVLGGTEPFFEYGYVEVTASDDAAEDFRLWVTDIENSLATEHEETGTSIDDMHRLSNEKRYVVLSIALLMEGQHRGFAGFSEKDERQYTRHGMMELLRELLRVDFDRVDSDAVFLAPGNDEDGFSSDDLHQEGWEYLIPLS